MKFAFLFAILCSQLMADNYVSFESSPAISALVFQTRDPATEKPEFRRSLKKIGEYLGVEISKDLSTKQRIVKTLLDKEASAQILDQEMVLITVLRAGLPFYEGMMKVFPEAESGFFAIARNEKTLLPTVYYKAMPDLQGKTVVIADVMLATGGSILSVIKEVEKRNPLKIIVACTIASTEGIKQINEYNPDIKVYTAAKDPVLNNIGYIVPGLGDAGDRAFGEKR
jgi:uracil phosphoribosyltransferase